MNKIKKILKVGQKAHFWVKNHQNLHVFTGFDTTPRSREKVETKPQHHNTWTKINPEI